MAAAMEVAVRRLGAIEAGRLELGRLTVVTGPNNTGKSYLAHALYGYHHFARSAFSEQRPDRLGHPVITPALFTRLMKGGKAEAKVHVGEMVDYFIRVHTHLQKQFRPELAAWLAGSNGDFAAARLGFTISKDRIEATVAGRLKKIKNRRIHQTVISHGNGKLRFSSCEDLKLSRWQLICDLDKLILVPVIRRPYLISSERLGALMFHRDVVANRSRISKAMGSVGGGGYRDMLLGETSRFGRAVGHEVDFAHDSDVPIHQKGLFYADPHRHYHRRIEEMLGARFKTDRKGTRLVAKSPGNGGFGIPLHMASTSARELFHLYRYLRHFAAPDDLLVVDEPESHLNSANQIQLARLLCRCVQAGVNVLITTHSEVILKEINHVIILGQLGKAADTVARQRRYYAGLAGIRQDDVRVYHCDGGTIKLCGFWRWGMRIPEIQKTLASQRDDGIYLNNQLLAAGGG